MAFVDGTCPKCSSPIRVDDTLLRCYCNSCGKPILISEAMGNEFSESASPKRRVAPEPSKQAEPPKQEAVTFEPSSAIFESSPTIDMLDEPVALSDLEDEKPGAGKTFGVFVLAWFIIGCICATETWIGAGMLYGVTTSRPSTGGLVALIAGIVIAKRYRNRSAGFGNSMLLSAIIGLALGLAVLVLSPFFWTLIATLP